MPDTTDIRRPGGVVMEADLSLNPPDSLYRKRPVVVTAYRWFKNGDHPFDGGADSEGGLVRYYRTPELDGQDRCRHCGTIMHLHGWIETLEGGHIVCPGDWIIQGVDGEHYPCKPSIFEKTYEAVIDA